MKKIFTLIAVAMMALSANAQTETDIPLNEGAWCWGWNSTVSVDAGVMTIQLTDNYGAGGTGWDPAADWSGYAKICAVIESYTGGWGQLVVKFSDDTDVTQSFGTISSTTTVTLDFDGNPKAKAVKSFAIQGGMNNPTIKVSRVYLLEKLNYQEPRDVEFTVNEDGSYAFVPAEKLNIYTDAAKVEFTINAEGPTISNYIGWGIGKFESAGAGVKIGGDFALKAPGDNTYVYTIKELRPAFEGDANGNGDKGLGWVMYGQGKPDNTFTYKSLKVYELEGVVIPDGIRAITTNEDVNAPMYNLAGQRVDASFKGVVIKNGKKVVIK